MAPKYDLLPMSCKYDISPQQFLFTPSSSSSTTSNIPFTTQPPSHGPVGSTAEEPMAPITGTLHRVPTAPRLSTSSDSSIDSTTARLILSSSRHIAQRDYTGTIYPTAVLRLFAGILLVVSIALFASGRPQCAVAALFFNSLSILRIIISFIVHTPRSARWLGWRGANVLIDFALVAGLAGSMGKAYDGDGKYYRGHLAACILGWISCGPIAFAAVDTGRPTRIAITTTLGLDFWTGRDALSLDNWDSERPDVE